MMEVIGKLVVCDKVGMSMKLLLMFRSLFSRLVMRLMFVIMVV